MLLVLEVPGPHPGARHGGFPAAAGRLPGPANYRAVAEEAKRSHNRVSD